MKAVARRLVLVLVPAVLLATACSSSGGSSGSSSPASSQPTTPPASIAGGPVDVGLTEWTIAPSVTTGTAGSVTFTVTNNGTTTHEFVVLRTKTPAANIPIGTFEGEKERINEDTAGKNVGETGDMAVGATNTLQIDLKPGHYALVCNLPGHYEQGMHTDFVVT